FGETEIRHQLPQLRVLIPQLLGFLCLAHIHPAVLRLPGIDRVFDTPLLEQHLPPYALPPAASTPRSSALPCACSATYTLPPSFNETILSFVRKEGIRSAPQAEIDGPGCRCLE